MQEKNIQACCDRQKVLLLESDVETMLQNIALTDAKEGVSFPLVEPKGPDTFI